MYKSSRISKMLFIEKIEILRNLFLRLEEFGNNCGTNFCDLGPKSQKFVPQKLMPQHFMPAKINALKVSSTKIIKICEMSFAYNQ